MKNSKYYFGGVIVILILLTLPLISHAQEVTQAGEGFFSKIGSWVKGNLMEMALTAVGTLLSRYGVTKFIKSIANKGKVVLKEVGEFCLDGSAFLANVDLAIKDDNTIDGNSINELIAQGKHLVLEGKDVYMEIKPK
jgi:hypothetical protein